MINIARSVFFIILISAGFIASVNANNSVNLQQIINEAARYEKMQYDKESSVAWLSQLLENDYGYSAIDKEKNSHLLSLYQDAAWMLRNGYPISGGILVTIARNNQAFVDSPAGMGMTHFVDAMLQSTDDDDDDILNEYMKKAQRAVSLLKTLSGAKAMAAQLYVVGDIYADSIAFSAGKAALDQLATTNDEWIVIETVRQQNNNGRSDE